MLRKVGGMEKKIEVVAGVIFDGNKVLAAQRGYGKYEGYWEFPGGKIEEGETHKQALARELKEELEVEVEVGEIMTTINYNYPDFQLVMYCYKTKIIGGEIKLLEHKDYCFVDANHIMLLDWLPADLGFVKELKEYLTNI